MATAGSFESILVVDCGSTTTRAVLIDLVDGRYRFIAKGEVPSTFAALERDLLLGVRRAIQQVEEITGRVFLDEAGQLLTPEKPEGRGVDALLAISNAAHPLRLVLAGLSDQISLASARRAAHSAYTIIEHVLSPEVEESRKQTVEDKIALIETTHPDVIVVTGGVDGSQAIPVADLVECVTLGCTLISNSSKPQIVYAGNATLRNQIAEVVGDKAQLLVLDNVRPSLDAENLGPLSSELNSFYQQEKLARLPGFDTLNAWSMAPTMTSSRAFGYVIKYLAQMWGSGHGVLGLDIGGTMTTVASVVHDEFSLITRSDLGVSHSIGNVLAQAGLDRIVRWLPFEMDKEAVRDRLLNKQLRSSSLPQTQEDLFLEQAVAREALRLTLDEIQDCWREHTGWPGPDLCPQFEAIVGTGGLLTHAPQHGQATIILLDAIQPTGVTTLWLDETSLAGPVGALAAVHPLAAAQLMEGDAFLNLGTAICPVGTAAHPGDVILRLTITYSDSRTLDVEIPYGSVEVIPLPLGEQASLEVRPVKGFDIGCGPGKKRVIKRLVGGMMGLVVDARGRPITLPSDEAERLNKVQQWYRDIGA